MFQTPSAYHTARTIGTGQSNSGDVQRLRRALKLIGFGRFPSPGAPNVTPGLMEATKRFQTAFGLKPDAVIRPGGPTERALSMATHARNHEGEAAVHGLRDAFARRAEAGLTFRPHPEDRNAGQWHTADGRMLNDAQADAFTATAAPPGAARSLLSSGAGMDVMMGSGGQDSLAASTRAASTRGGADRANPVTPEIAQRRARVANPARPTGVVKPPGSDQRFLDRVEHDMRERYVEDWRDGGKPRAADNLERYLDGSGKPLIFSRDKARSFRPIKQAEERIRNNFETLTLVTQSGNTDSNEKLKSLKDGETVEIEDDWDGDYKGVGALQDAVGGTSEEQDFYRAFGRTSVTGKARIRATRKRDTLYFDGVATHKWDDTYDFHPPEPGSGEAHALEDAGRAKPFRFGAAWKQRMRGTARTHNGKITDPEIEWTDVEQ